jgi:hypothetical protein
MCGKLEEIEINERRRKVLEKFPLLIAAADFTALSN